MNPLSDYGVSDRDYAAAIGTMMGEAYGEGPLGMAAVLDVMSNRLSNPRGYGAQSASLEAIAFGTRRGGMQFDTWNRDVAPQAYAISVTAQRAALDPEYARTLPAAFQDRLQQATVAAHGVLGSQELAGITGGSTFYGNRSAMSQARTAEHDARGNSITIGNHTFTGGYAPMLPDVEGALARAQNAYYNDFNSPGEKNRQSAWAAQPNPLASFSPVPEYRGNLAVLDYAPTPSLDLPTPPAPAGLLADEYAQQAGLLNGSQTFLNPNLTFGGLDALPGALGMAPQGFAPISPSLPSMALPGLAQAPEGIGVSGIGALAPPGFSPQEAYSRTGPLADRLSQAPATEPGFSFGALPSFGPEQAYTGTIGQQGALAMAPAGFTPQEAPRNTPHESALPSFTRHDQRNDFYDQQAQGLRNPVNSLEFAQRDPNFHTYRGADFVTGRAPMEYAFGNLQGTRPGGALGAFGAPAVAPAPVEEPQALAVPQAPEIAPVAPQTPAPVVRGGPGSNLPPGVPEEDFGAPVVPLEQPAPVAQAPVLAPTIQAPVSAPQPQSRVAAPSAMPAPSAPQQALQAAPSAFGGRGNAGTTFGGLAPDLGSYVTPYGNVSAFGPPEAGTFNGIDIFGGISPTRLDAPDYVQAAALTPGIAGLFGDARATVDPSWGVIGTNGSFFSRNATMENLANAGFGLAAPGGFGALNSISGLFGGPTFGGLVNDVRDYFGGADGGLTSSFTDALGNNNRGNVGNDDSYGSIW